MRGVRDADNRRSLAVTGRFSMIHTKYMHDNSPLLDPVIAIARRAGAAILDVYHRPEGFDVTDKADASPLTAADLAAHRIIADSLALLTPDMPLLSEESGNPSAWDERRHWQRYWLVDPLDGTREFVAKSGDFTVNIALIDQGVPVLGVVYVPVTDVIYAGLRTTDAAHAGSTAFRENSAGRVPIQVRTLHDAKMHDGSVTVVASRRHGGERLPALLAQLAHELGAYSLTNIGSSLKICRVAEGRADFYPRLGPTSEWDTAAAQAVLEAAGGALLDSSLRPLRYNRGESLRNPDFYAIGDAAARWQWLAAVNAAR